MLFNVERKIFLLIKLLFFSCNGTGMIPSHYLRCPKCGGQGEGLLKDCHLCDDLCYVTEPYVPCPRCRGSGDNSRVGILDCAVCHGAGFIRSSQAGMGMGMGY